MIESLPRETIAFLPTPLHRMPNLGGAIGLDNLWIKRDDLTGLSVGGNKTRKLEFVIGDARQSRADTLVTVGAIQSNHCRQTAAAAAATGFRCVLLLAGEEPDVYTGNLLLSMLFGAELKFFPDIDFSGLNERLATITDTLEELGLTPYAIPAGASMPQGVIAYAAAMKELKEQTDAQGIHPEKIVLATGTGSTQAGLIIGAHMLGLKVEIIGVSVLHEAEVAISRISELISRTVDTYPDLDSFKPKIIMDDQFIGEGYGLMSEGARSAIEMFAKTEGILLDPVYTGKAGLAIIKMTMAGDIAADASTIFWHTGGSPALFAHADGFR